MDTFKFAQGGQEDTIGTGVPALIAQLVDLASNELAEPLQLRNAVDDVLDRVGEL